MSLRLDLVCLVVLLWLPGLLDMAGLVKLVGLLGLNLLLDLIGLVELDTLAVCRWEGVGGGQTIIRFGPLWNSAEMSLGEDAGEE